MDDCSGAGWSEWVCIIFVTMQLLVCGDGWVDARASENVAGDFGLFTEVVP